MALNPHFSTGFRDALIDGGDLTTMFAGGQLDIYSGTQPADADTTEGAGTVLASITLPGGSDLVTNGTMSADTDWSGTGGSWTISGGTATSDGTQVGDADISQDISAVSGYEYVVTFTVSNYSAGNVTAVIGDTEGTDRAANGTFTETITAGAGTDIDIRADVDFDGDIDDVSVYLYPFVESADSGEIDFNGLWQDSSADATGTAAWFRLYDSNVTTGASTTAVRIDGTVGNGTFDLNISGTSITSGDQISVDSFTIGITA